MAHVRDDDGFESPPRLRPSCHSKPAPHDWYVLGRIAENYGATDAAVAAYRKVDKPKESVLSSTWVLAERRLKAMKK